MINNDGLLFIEPTAPPAAEPLIDSLTRRVAAAYRASEPGDARWRGFHICSCGAHSDSCNFVIEPGLETNSLCVHYVAYHRSGMTQRQIERVLRQLKDFTEEVEPTEKELYRPPTPRMSPAEFRREYMHEPIDWETKETGRATSNGSHIEEIPPRTSK